MHKHLRHQSLLVNELQRIGIDPGQVDSLVLPPDLAIFELLSRMRQLPDDAGIDAFMAVLEDLRPAVPPWTNLPDPNHHFSVDDYEQAFSLINADPTGLAQLQVQHGLVSPVILALLSLASVELAARVEQFRAEWCTTSIANGVSREVIETADEHFRRAMDDMRRLVRIDATGG